MRIPSLIVAASLGLQIALAGMAASSPLRNPIEVKVDHVYLLRLDRDADTVYIANPGIADVTVDSPRRIFVLGRQPGTTNLIVLDSSGEEIVSAAVTVEGPPLAEVSTGPAPATRARPATVTVNRGTASTQLQCTPRCGPAEMASEP